MEQAMSSLYVGYNALGLPGALWAQHGLDHPLAPDHPGQIGLVPSKASREAVETAMERTTPELLKEQYYFGSPEQIADTVAPLVDAGCRHFVLANMGGNFTGRGAADFASMAELTERLRKM